MPINDRFYIKDLATDKIRFTTAGKKEFTSRFARAGIDIRTIDTEEVFKRAKIATHHILVEDMFKEVEGNDILTKALEPLKKILPIWDWRYPTE